MDPMSFPIIPDIKPDIKLDHKQVVDMLLASIAQEEKGLAHIINVEGEKLKFILGKLQCPCAGEAELESLKEMNREVRRTLQTVLKSQMLLQVNGGRYGNGPPCSAPPASPSASHSPAGSISAAL
jgi:hypothetical protein